MAKTLNKKKRDVVAASSASLLVEISGVVPTLVRAFAVHVSNLATIPSAVVARHIEFTFLVAKQPFNLPPEPRAGRDTLGRTELAMCSNSLWS